MISLIKKLSHSSDVNVRNEGLEDLKKWLPTNETLEKDDMMKIFQGIYHCFWLAEPQNYQDSIANIFSEIPLSCEKYVALTYYRCFYETLINFWFSIDKHRYVVFLIYSLQEKKKAL